MRRLSSVISVYLKDLVPLTLFSQHSPTLFESHWSGRLPIWVYV